MKCPSNFISLLHPCSKRHHALQDFLFLDGRKKTAVSIITSIVAILTIPLLGLPGVLTFRCLVKKFSKSAKVQDQPTRLKIEKLTKQHLLSKKVIVEEVPQKIMTQFSVLDELPIENRPNTKGLPNETPLEIPQNAHLPIKEDPILPKVNQQDLLLKAIEQNDILAIHNYIEPKADFNFVDKDGNLPLHHAILSGNFDLIQLLAPHTILINQANHKGETPLRLAFKCFKKDRDLDKLYKVVVCLKEHKADMDLPGTNGSLPFHWAIKYEAFRKNNPELLDLLYAHHHLMKDNNGWTALHYAVSKNNEEIVDYLLKQNNYYPNIANTNGDIPLYLAVKKGFLKIAKVLMWHIDTSTVDQQNEQGNTLLNLAADLIPENLNFALQEFIEILLDEGDTDIPNHLGNLPLHTACYHGAPKIIKEIMQDTLDINRKNDEGLTPLHILVKKGYIDSVKLLLKNQADVNIADNRGKTPLDTANELGCLEIANLLKPHQPKAIVEDLYDINRAVLEENIEALKKLLKDGADANKKFDESLPIHFAALNDNLEMVKLLAPKTKRINEQNKHERTAIYLGVSSHQDSAEIVRVLLDFGADPKIKDRDGDVPLHRAASRSSIEVGKLLINRTDINIQNNFKATPLHFAAQNKRSEFIVFLLEHGADPQIQNIYGHLPLHFLVEEGDIKTIQLLVSKMKDLNIKDHTGRTPLTIAHMAKRQDVVDFLIENGAIK